MRALWCFLVAGVALAAAPDASHGPGGWWPFSSLEGKDAPQLWSAAKAGDFDAAEAMIDAGADLEAGDPDGNTALVWASYHGHEDVVKLLLDGGANTEARNKEGNSALVAASFTGQASVVKLLLEAGADLEGRNVNGDTALIGAAFFGQPEVVRLLLGRGANVEGINHEGRSPLELAVGKQHTEVAAVLTEHLAATAATQLATLPVRQWSSAAVQRWVSEQQFSGAASSALLHAFSTQTIDGEALLLLREEHFNPTMCPWTKLCAIPFPVVVKLLSRVASEAAEAKPSPPVPSESPTPEPCVCGNTIPDDQVEAEQPDEPAGDVRPADVGGSEVTEVPADTDNDKGGTVDDTQGGIPDGLQDAENAEETGVLDDVDDEAATEDGVDDEDTTEDGADDEAATEKGIDDGDVGGVLNDEDIEEAAEEGVEAEDVEVDSVGDFEEWDTDVPPSLQA